MNFTEISLKSGILLSVCSFFRSLQSTLTELSPVYVSVPLHDMKMCPDVCKAGKYSTCKYEMLKAETMPDTKLA